MYNLWSLYECDASKLFDKTLREWWDDSSCVQAYVVGKGAGCRMQTDVNVNKRLKAGLAAAGPLLRVAGGEGVEWHPHSI